MVDSDEADWAYAKQEGFAQFLQVGPPVAQGIYDTVNPNNTTPFPCRIDDLVRLHRLVIQRKVTTILEFGVGKSTLILAHALAANKAQHGEFVAQNLRRANAFEIHSVDVMQKYIDATRKSLPHDLRNIAHFHQSDVSMAEFMGRICTLYDKLPNICPDLIYLDAPDQFAPKNPIRGITTAHADRLPMSADILAIEHFLLPGTLIVIDGRTANARFLKANFQRNWHYQYDVAGDVHTFELVEQPLGKYNKAQIEYCLGSHWTLIRRDAG